MFNFSVLGVGKHTVQQWSASEIAMEPSIWNCSRMYEITAKVFIQHESNQNPKALGYLGAHRSDSFESLFAIQKKNGQPWWWIVPLPRVTNVRVVFVLVISATHKHSKNNAEIGRATPSILSPSGPQTEQSIWFETALLCLATYPVQASCTALTNENHPEGCLASHGPPSHKG